MAARRLITILIALLVVSSFAAALAPQEPAEESTTSSESTEVAEDTGNGARQNVLVEERIPARVERPPQLIELQAGDQLELVVEVARAGAVQIPGLGESSFASPGTPARFDLLPRSAGDYPVTVEGGEAVGRLQVSD